MHADRQTDRRTNERTDSHIRPHARAHAHTRTLACLHAHPMHSGTYARTDRYTHTCSYGGKHPSTNMEVRSKKLQVRSEKLEIKNVAHALRNARMCEQIFGRANMHAHRQTDGRTDGLKHTPSRMRACKHTNTCIDERTHVRSNIWTHEHARGQTDRQTDGRTDSYICPYARAHANTRTLTCLHALRYIRG